MAENGVQNVNQKNKREVVKADIFEEYILWAALPLPKKKKIGVETQEDFADMWKISVRSLSRWNDRPEFEDRVRHLRRKWAFHATGDVMWGIYASALKGNDKSQKLWMQMFEGFTEKTEEIKTVRVEITVNDIRHIIEGLKEPLRTKHYDNLTQLLIDADTARQAGEYEDAVVIDGLEGEVSDEAGIDAQVVSDERPHKVSYRHSGSVCEDLERQVSSNNYQSAARWW